MGSLFNFTTHTFTTGGNVGRYGPTLATLQSAYSGQAWSSNSLYFTQGRSQGYQVFTIPRTGVYQIECAGARGQNSSNTQGQYGQGAIIRARISFNINDKLEMVVGQVPGNGGSTNPGNSFAGAGGGTFVAYNGTSTPILVAGGGGGSYSTYNTQTVIDGQTRRRPRFSGYNYSPASDGFDPAIGGGGLGYHGGGGGGFNTSGQDYSGWSGSSSMGTDPGPGQPYTHGASFVGGSVSNASGPFYATGGSATNLASEGGFGGGGGGHSGNNTGGGGGGYSGGLGGQTSLGGSINSGVGGGSFIISTATNVGTSNGLYDDLSTFNSQSITNLGITNNSSGYIIITFIG